MASTSSHPIRNGGGARLDTPAGGRPIVLYRPIVGHGVDGAKALAEDGLATHATSPSEAIDALRRIQSGTDPDLRARVARARAMFDDGAVRASDVVMDHARAGHAQRAARG